MILSGVHFSGVNTASLINESNITEFEQTEPADSHLDRLAMEDEKAKGSLRPTFAAAVAAAVAVAGCRVYCC